MDEEKIVNLLERIVAALETKLGFGEPPMPKYVFIKNEGKYLWYFLDTDHNEQVPIHARALTGTILGFKLVQKEFKGKEKNKLDIFISADQVYALRSGLETTFSKGLLLALDSLTTQQIKNPLTIGVKPGEENTVFCNVFVGSERIKTEWNPDADWEKIVENLQQKLGCVQNFNKESNQFDRDEVMKRIEQYMQRLGWSTEAGKRYINDVYGKSSRLQMEPHELLEFMQHLETVSTSRV